MASKLELTVSNCSEKMNNDMFSGCVIYLCKAYLSKSRYSLFENKVKDNCGLLTTDPKNQGLTHVVLEDSLCNNNDNCLNILKKAGFTETELMNLRIVKVEWICECLKQKQKVDSKIWEVKLPLNEQKQIEVPDGNFGENATHKNYGCPNEETESDDLNPPELKKMKEDSVDNSKYMCSQVSCNERDLSKNQNIINDLQKLADAFRSQGDQWRSYSYEKAIRAIKNYNSEITSFEEAKAIPGIGERIALKVKEMLEEGRIRKVKEICSDEKSKVLELFSGVWGAGPTTVQAWYRKGYRTLEDLETKATLTKQQKVGLKYYFEIQDRMPRTEVEEIAELIKEKALAIDNSLEVIICGSYRRGKEKCGDVDIVIIKPDSSTSEDILFSLHKDLKKTGFITDDLTGLDEDGNDKKYLGMCKLPGENRKHRRLDIFVVRKSESACAIMHYTGSALFNRSIRLLANSRGMCLSEHSLSTDAHNLGKNVKNTRVVLDTPTEESIFEHLGLEYRLPEQRDH